MAQEPEWLTLAEAAALANVGRSTWSSYVTRGYAPAPDGQGPGRGWQPRWSRTAVEAYRDGRLGQGRRTDLVEGRRTRREADERALAEPTTTLGAELSQWLHQHQWTLLTVAGRLVDHRDELLRLVAAPDELAAAVDQAGASMSKEPSRAMASAVSYALVLLRQRTHEGDAELMGWLERLWWLHEQYDAVRG